MQNNVFLVTEGQAKIIIVKFVNTLSTKIGDFLSKTIHSTLENCYFCILLVEIVAQWDNYYRIESTRKCIRSCSPTPTVSKAHNFFSRGDNLLNFVVLYTLEYWLQDQVDRKSFHNVSNVAPNVNLPLAWPFTPVEISVIISIVNCDSLH